MLKWNNFLIKLDSPLAWIQRFSKTPDIYGFKCLFRKIRCCIIELLHLSFNLFLCSSLAVREKSKLQEDIAARRQRKLLMRHARKKYLEEMAVREAELLEELDRSYS